MPTLKALLPFATLFLSLGLFHAQGRSTATARHLPSPPLSPLPAVSHKPRARTVPAMLLTTRVVTGLAHTVLHRSIFVFGVIFLILGFVFDLRPPSMALFLLFLALETAADNATTTTFPRCHSLVGANAPRCDTVTKPPR